MKLPQHVMPVCRALVQLLLLAAAFLAMIMKAGATELPVYGGPGGEAEFQIVCPAGSFVTGFQGKASGWIDSLTVLCTRLDKQTGKWDGAARPEALPPTRLTSAGNSPRGMSGTVSCKDGHVVTGANSWHLRAEQAGLLQRLQFRCAYVPNPMPDSRRGHEELQFPLQAGRAIDSSHPYSGWKVCPAGEAVTGIQGYSGSFIDAIGLICGPLGDGSKEHGEQLPMTGDATISPFGPMRPTSAQGVAAKDN